MFKWTVCCEKQCTAAVMPSRQLQTQHHTMTKALSTTWGSKQLHELISLEEDVCSVPRVLHILLFVFPLVFRPGFAN